MDSRVVILIAWCAAGCGPKPPPSAASGAPACVADPSWITRPRPPGEVASAETFCDFYQFSWQWFLAQVSPADPSKPRGERVFEATNRVVDPDPGNTDQCNQRIAQGRDAAIQALAIRTIKPDQFEDKQADNNPLYDQGRNVLYYSIWYSPAECQATTAGFAPGTLEIKVAWRILPAPDPTYFTMIANLPAAGPSGQPVQQNVVLGLVGFHLVNWTSHHPEMIWATFEHKANAPLCAGTSTAPPAGWSLASPAAAQCLAQHPSPDGELPAACATFDFDDPAKASGPPPITGTPDEVCELFKDGTDPGTSVNGNDNAANAAAIDQLNDALVGPGGLVTRLGPDDPMAVWSHYRMTGGLWTKGGQASGALPVPNKQRPPDPYSPQRGSLELANVTMETYEQGASSSVPNCFGCHGYTPTTPLTVSHIALKYLLPPLN
jgi:hypothetical protein